MIKIGEYEWERLLKDIGTVHNVAAKRYEEGTAIVIPAAGQEERELSSIW